MKHKSIAALCAFLPLALTATPAVAQTYPVKAVRIVIPFPAGGGADAIIRPMQPRLTELLGQSLVLDNRPGANGNIAAENVARSAPDGYSILLGNSSLPISATLYSKLPFDVVKDFTPITLVSVSPSVLVVHPSLPVKSIKDLIALARQRPGKLNFASAGTGSTPHLAVELIKAMAKVDMTHVPYKGAAPAIIDVVGGQCEFMVVNIPPVIGQVQAGKLNAVAVTSVKRASVLPDVPTVAESGLPGYESTTWYGMLGPAGLPREMVNRLQSAVATTITTPEVRQRLLAAGSEPESNTPDKFAEFIRADIAAWAKVIKASGARAE